MAGVIPGYQPSALETALPNLEGRMEAFGLEVAALSDNADLSDAERQARITALWREYGPDIAAVTASASEVGLNTAGNILAGMNIAAIIETALSQVDIAGAIAEADMQVALSQAAAALGDVGAEAGTDDL